MNNDNRKAKSKVNYLYTEEFNACNNVDKEYLKVIFNKKIYKTIMKIEKMNSVCYE